MSMQSGRNGPRSKSGTAALSVLSHNCRLIVSQAVVHAAAGRSNAAKKNQSADAAPRCASTVNGVFPSKEGAVLKFAI